MDAPELAARKRRINRSPEQWRDLVWEQQRSGLSVQAFCGSVGASTTAFARWRRHFAQAPDPAARTRAAARKRNAVACTQTPPAFVEIAAPMRALEAGFKLRLDLGGGIVLELVRG